jgi:hypothetical protein
MFTIRKIYKGVILFFFMDELQAKQIEVLEAQKVLLKKQFEAQILNLDRKIAQIQNGQQTGTPPLPPQSLNY